MGEITMENLDSLFDKKLAPIRSTLEDLTTLVSFLSERFDAIEKKVKICRSRQIQSKKKTTTSDLKY